MPSRFARMSDASVQRVTLYFEMCRVNEVKTKRCESKRIGQRKLELATRK